MVNTHLMNKILVTGSNGQLGSEFQFLAEKYPNLDFFFFDKANLDISDKSAVQSIFEKHSFSYLINCAAYTKVDKAEEEPEIAFQINVQAIEILAQLCKANNTIFIHISTDYVYDPEHFFANDENMECSPKSNYAKSKLKGELVLSKMLERYIIIRSSWIYSSFGYNFVKTMIKLGKEKTELRIVNDQIGSPTYARDLAEAILEIIRVIEHSSEQNKFWGTYNYSNLGFISWDEFASEIFKIANLSCKIIPIPSSEYPSLASRPINSRLSKSKIADTFQLQLKHWKKSLQKCIGEIDIA